MFGIKKKRKINESTLVGDIVDKYPEAVPVLQEYGMHCLGCASSRNETLYQACMVHGLSAKEIMDAVNAKLAEEDAKKEE